MIHAQALEAALHGSPHIIRAAVDAAGVRVTVVADHAELGGQENPITASGDRFTHQFLIDVRTIHVGGIDQGDPLIQRRVQRGDGLPVVAATVEITHAHAAQPQGGDLRAVPAQTSFLHCRYSCR